MLIAFSCLVAALALFGDAAWPAELASAVTAVAVTLGLAYTVYSEWMNVAVRESWAYSRWMPLVPVLGTGLSPLLQWLLVPTLGLWWARGVTRSSPPR